MAKIDSFDFTLEEVEMIRQEKYGEKWPVVYFIHNEHEAYIGETTNVYLRTTQHLKAPIRKELKKIHIISDEEFNMSAIMDIESALIKYVSADNHFKLQNSNGGLQNHNYYQKDHYQEKIFRIWEKLQKKNLVFSSLKDIENSDLFKYSPYKSLSTDQYLAVDFILQSLAEDFNIPKTFMVNGSAGTGKTVLAVYLIKLLKSFEKNKYLLEEEQDVSYISNILTIVNSQEQIKIGLVIPQVSLRKTLKLVFRSINGLSSSMVMGPSEVLKDKYDLLIVDEAHRLKRRVNITNFASFDSNNSTLGLNNEGTEFDWILSQSKHQILFYDADQSIRPSDIRKSSIESLLLNKTKNTEVYHLKSQLRSLGGNDYVEYIKSVFSNNPPLKRLVFKNYDLGIYEDINTMVDRIKLEDNKVGLSRIVSGYAWEWKTKNHTPDDIKSKNLFDITINNTHLVWNTTNEDWVNSPNAINEVGCIHTTQGYDLNYTGLIIGEELSYDPINKKLLIRKENYYDSNGYRSIKDSHELEQYILNIYSTLALRAIKGTFIYVCDNDLREYLKQYIAVI